MPKGILTRLRVQHVLVVGEDALGGLGAQVGQRRGILHRADVGLEHHVELAGVGQPRPHSGHSAVAPAGSLSARAMVQATRSARSSRRRRVLLLAAATAAALASSASSASTPTDSKTLSPSLATARKTLSARKRALQPLAVHQRVVEVHHVAGRLPDLGVHDDGAVQADDVVALADDVVPPGVLDVALQLHAQRAVVPKAVDAAVDLGRRKDETPPLAQRHQLVHQVVGIIHGHFGNAFIPVQA